MLTLPVDRIAPKKLSIAYFAPDGLTVEDADPVNKDTVPAGADFATWKEIGCIQDHVLNVPNLEGGEDHFCPNAETGEWDLVESADSNANMTQSLEIQFNKVTDYLLMMAWAAKEVDPNTGAFTPGSQPGGVYRGWIYFQNQRGTEIETVVKHWVDIKVMEATKLANRTEGHKPKIMVTLLGNDLNGSTLGTVTP